MYIKKPNKCFFILTVMMLSLLFVTGCGGGRSEEPSGDDSLKKVLDSGQLVIGLDPNFPPMGFTDGTGEVVGFDIDVARECCERLGIALVSTPIDWDMKDELLNGGEIDCIWNGMSITPERQESMELSMPYMKNKLIFLVPQTSEAKNSRDLKGKKVGVQSSSTASDMLKDFDLYGNITVVENDSNVELLGKLRNGEVDAILIDSVFAYYSIFSRDDSFYVLSDSLGEEKYAIGFRKGDRKLRDRIQELVDEMRADGTLAGISKKWFSYDITIAR